MGIMRGNRQLIRASFAAHNAPHGVARQLTSVRNNNSLSMSFATGITARPWSVFVQAKVLDWASGPATFQDLLPLTNSNSLVYYDRTAGTFKTYTAGNTLYGSPAPQINKYTGWAAINMVCDAGGNVTARFKPSGGVVFTAAVGSGFNALTFAELFMSTTFGASERCFNAAACTYIITNYAMSLSEFNAQSASQTPVGTPWAYYPMVSATTVGVDASGNGRNMTVTGVGVTITDSPY